MPTKIKSTFSYSHDYPDGSGIKTNCYLNGNSIAWHIDKNRQLPESIEIEVIVQKYEVESVIDTPIGGIPTMKTTDKKEFVMTIKQYKDFIIKFWENGPEYYDMI